MTHVLRRKDHPSALGGQPTVTSFAKGVFGEP
jgi:hypothetical protein